MADLRTLARAATPGPWTVDSSSARWLGGSAHAIRTVEKDARHPWSRHFVCWLMGGDADVVEADADYIAAASPDVVLRLLNLAGEAVNVAEILACNHERDSECARCEFLHGFRAAVADVTRLLSGGDDG